MPKFNRRQFLGSTAAAAAFAAAPAIVQAAVVEKKVDLVIVGGGLAGLAAANAAVKKGVKPIVLEKEAFLGGPGCSRRGRSASARATRRSTVLRRPCSRCSTRLCSSTTIAVIRPSFVC